MYTKIMLKRYVYRDYIERLSKSLRKLSRVYNFFIISFIFSLGYNISIRLSAISFDYDCIANYFKTADTCRVFLGEKGRNLNEMHDVNLQTARGAF